MHTTHVDDVMNRRLDRLLGLVYGKRAAEARDLLDAVLDTRISALAPLVTAKNTTLQGSASGRYTEKDALLIAYGDMVAPPRSGNENPQTALKRLDATIERHMYGLFDYLHVLPFYPYSSDDGFSVMDYRTVNPVLGSWSDIEALGSRHRLVFDLVLNHASAQGSWFKAFKAGKAPYNRYFITRPLDYDASTVLRPRTHPLITPVRLDDGRITGVWTTFSEDQVDLDFSEPAVLAEFVDISLEYALHGARMLRLDAIAYLWKQDGTSCAHLPQTHAIVRILRAIIDGLGLDLSILTETNVPHAQNMAYFGHGGDDVPGDDVPGDEAHLVYNFSLPPLVLHAFATGDASPLSRWAAGLRVPAGGTMLNFLASHDGIGVTPALGLVDDFTPTVAAVLERGGLVSYKATPNGPVPYELNISWADAIARPEADDEERARALIASYAIACAMDGIPAIYFHSVIGSRNWQSGPGILGYNRAINRERPALDALESDLADPDSMRAISLAGLTSLLRERFRRQAFAPASPRTAFAVPGPVFMVERGSGSDALLVLVNCAREPARVSVPEAWRFQVRAFDPVGGSHMNIDPLDERLMVPGYAVRWLERTS
ncbi:MAG TPA: alpha-amylase family glycosyl hydrolase [bacterium]|nr:alpha-amylase family glycosyl hydrolase [bacterium]